jgi:very-short-patch-repair endonuclease
MGGSLAICVFRGELFVPRNRETLEEYLARGGKITRMPVPKPPPKQDRLRKNAERHRQKYAHGEKEVAQVLESLGVKYEFQKIMTHYIVDFYLPDHNTIIEVDGLSHKWRKQKRRDMIRDHYFMRRGIPTVRVPAECPSEEAIKAGLRKHEGSQI